MILNYDCVVVSKKHLYYKYLRKNTTAIIITIALRCILTLPSQLLFKT